jgi:hypothetical protein
MKRLIVTIIAAGGLSSASAQLLSPEALASISRTRRACRMHLHFNN